MRQEDTETAVSKIVVLRVTALLTVVVYCTGCAPLYFGVVSEREDAVRCFVKERYARLYSDRHARIERIEYYFSHAVDPQPRGAAGFINPVIRESTITLNDDTPTVSICTVIGARGVVRTNVGCMFERLYFKNGTCATNIILLGYSDDRKLWTETFSRRKVLPAED